MIFDPLCRPWATLALLCGLCGVAQADGAPAPAPLQTVAQLDLPRYMGTWHEVAKYPNRFQRDCVADTSAQYRLEDGGTVRVSNRCRQADGRFQEAVGQARPVGAPGTARLAVRFAPAWLSWWPGVWGDYWVIDLDPAYQLVAVSEPRREYLWVLSRTPKVDPEAYRALRQRLAQQGFDLSRLQEAPGAVSPP
ncbi:lipocalin family protein [Macromonas nakdongensis]|uniref:lipocalin family protein n=1 Tax=Macromonas nakdongensis TaxID=1843082 RepID=UPI000C326321|nr:lipocalin family protein [Macromonas nakdongensis]